MAENDAGTNRTSDTEAPRGGAQERPGPALARSSVDRRGDARRPATASASARPRRGRRARRPHARCACADRASRRSMSRSMIWPALLRRCARACWSCCPILGAHARRRAASRRIAHRRLEFLGRRAGAATSPRSIRPTGLGRMFSTRGAGRARQGLREVRRGRDHRGIVLLRRADAAAAWARSAEPVHGAIGHAVALAGYALLVLCCGLAIIAAVDVPFQLWQHAQATCA